MSKRRWLFFGMLFWAVPAITVAENWPKFRGPMGIGITSETQLPITWDTKKNVAWKVALPGVGWSSPVVWEDKIFVTTAMTEKQPRPKNDDFGGGGKGMGKKFDKKDFDKKKEFDPNDKEMKAKMDLFLNKKPPDDVYQFQVICLDKNTGKILWKETALEGKPKIPTHPSNSYASETPLVDGERVYAYFGMHGLYCYDLAGKQLWKKDLGSYRMAINFGTGSSPTLDDERLYVLCDNEEKSFLVALNKKTGDEVWRVDRSSKTTWSTPFLWKNKLRTELIICGDKNVQSFDPKTSKVLWELKGIDSAFSSTPVCNEEMIYFGTSGPMSNGPLFAVKVGASGDISLKKEEKKNDFVVWSRIRSGPGISSMLLLDNYLYIAGQGVLNCYDAKTGEEVYKGERLEGARGFTSSPWAYDGKIFFLDEDGKTFVIQPGKEFQLLGKNTINEMCWASPAVADGALYLRGLDHLYCIKPGK